ncbi:Adenylate isopentenyltransferase [Euphorbia peplus]|nr:Adenylate isopentenyltransferase [Euphorbia peplus]
MADTSSLHKDKLLVIMGPTGCGKTKLSIDLASRFPSEIINSDKIQVYNGLDVTTNKIPIPDRRGIPHHLLGVFDPKDGELTPSEFRLTAGLAVSDIVSRQKMPLLVGGSNSFIHALLVDRFNPGLDVFDPRSDRISTQLRYKCCFLWVHVSFPLLCDYLCKRVDEMLELGMFDELSEFYRVGDPGYEDGLRKAIGVPEFDRYFKKYPPGIAGDDDDDDVRRQAYEEAVREIKYNTCQLAKRQVGKIIRLKNAGWDLVKVDATEAFREVMRVSTENNNHRKKRRKKKRKRWLEIWETQVLEPSMKIVNQFLEDE